MLFKKIQRVLDLCAIGLKEGEWAIQDDGAICRVIDGTCPIIAGIQKETSHIYKRIGEDFLEGCKPPFNLDSEALRIVADASDNYLIHKFGSCSIRIETRKILLQMANLKDFESYSY